MNKEELKEQARLYTWILGILFLISFIAILFYAIPQLNQKKDNFYLSNLIINGSLTTHPRNIEFNADNVIFTDGNLTIVFNKSIYLNLDVDYLIFNVSNHIYKFKRER